MPQEQTQTDDNAPAVLDTQDNAAKMTAVNELLGINAEEPAKPERAEPDAEGEQSLSERLAEAERPSDRGESQDTVKPPKNLDELAERLGVKIDDLYAIEFPHNETGESLTLGALKDLQANESDYAGRELELAEGRVKFGNAQAKARQELGLVLKSRPEGEIKPEVRATARKEREVMLGLEAVRVLDVIPEWSDDDVQRADLAEIGDHMEQYGFDKGHIDQIVDHRMLRYMRDNLRRMKLVERALAGVKPVKSVPKGRTSQPARAKAKVQATPASTQGQQPDAIDKLLTPG